MDTCCCCHDRLLRHLNRHRVYWFCPTCHREMPNINRQFNNLRLESRKKKLFKSSVVNSFR